MMSKTFEEYCNKKEDEIICENFRSCYSCKLTWYKHRCGYLENVFNGAKTTVTDLESKLKSAQEQIYSLNSKIQTCIETYCATATSDAERMKSMIAVLDEKENP